MELLKQRHYSQLSMEEPVVVIFSGVKGYLDRIEVGQIGSFEKQLLTEMHAKHQALLDTIREEAALSSETDEKLHSILDSFTTTFA